mgnify:FL=1
MKLIVALFYVVLMQNRDKMCTFAFVTKNRSETSIYGIN